MPISKKSKVVMGIDPGLATTGYGVIRHHKNSFETVACGVIVSGADEPFGQRLEKIQREVSQLIKKYRPETIAVEKLFFAKNAKTALTVGEARGVIVLTAWQSRQTVKEFTPLQVKQALTGYGLASKNQIQQMVKQTLRLKKIPKPDDAADALAIAICCGQTKNF